MLFLFLHLDIATKCPLSEAIRYLDYHPEFSTYPGGKTPLSEDPDAPDDEEEVKTRRGFQELLSALLLNSALAAIKLGDPINLRTAISLANRAIGFALSDADRGRHSSQLDTDISDNDDRLSQGIVPSGAGPHSPQGRSGS